jgi:hypothetical protein
MTPVERAKLQKDARDEYEALYGVERSRFASEYFKTMAERKQIMAAYEERLNAIAVQYAEEMEAAL